MSIDRSKERIFSMAHTPHEQLAKLSASAAQSNKQLLVADYFLIMLGIEWTV